MRFFKWFVRDSAVCFENPSAICGLVSQTASKAESVSIAWCHPESPVEFNIMRSLLLCNEDFSNHWHSTLTHTYIQVKTTSHEMEIYGNLLNWKTIWEKEVIIIWNGIVKYEHIKKQQTFAFATVSNSQTIFFPKFYPTINQHTRERWLINGNQCSTRYPEDTRFQGLVHKYHQLMFVLRDIQGKE